MSILVDRTGFFPCWTLNKIYNKNGTLHFTEDKRKEKNHVCNVFFILQNDMETRYVRPSPVKIFYVHFLLQIVSTFSISRYFPQNRKKDSFFFFKLKKKFIERSGEWWSPKLMKTGWEVTNSNLTITKPYSNYIFGNTVTFIK